MLDYRDYPELSAEFVAAHPMDDPRFEPWLEAWYGEHRDEPEPGSVAYQDEETAMLFIARAWMMGPELTNRFPLQAIGSTIWGQHNDIEWYAPLDGGGRLMWDATYQLYTSIFEPNANQSLGHLSEGSGDFQGAIYMFWDSARWYAGAPGATDSQRNHFMRICKRALASPKASLQESALHGLGHATMYMAEAGREIGRFLHEGKPRRPELRRYAEVALTGMIQ